MAAFWAAQKDTEQQELGIYWVGDVGHGLLYAGTMGVAMLQLTGAKDAGS